MFLHKDRIGAAATGGLLGPPQFILAPQNIYVEMMTVYTPNGS